MQISLVLLHICYLKFTFTILIKKYNLFVNVPYLDKMLGIEFYLIQIIYGKVVDFVV